MSHLTEPRRKLTISRHSLGSRPFCGLGWDLVRMHNMYHTYLMLRVFFNCLIFDRHSSFLILILPMGRAVFCGVFFWTHREG